MVHSRVIRYGDKTHHVRNFILIMFLVVVMMTGAVSGWLYYKADSTLPKLSERSLNAHEGHYSRIVSSDGATVWGDNHNTELNAKPNEIPPNIKRALFSIEDRDFYHERGVNYGRTIKAVVTDLLHRNREQGGSTLTEQLVKNSLDPNNNSSESKSIIRKAQEILLARKVGTKYPKNKILAMYVNKVYMGSGLFGMKTAAKYYFNRPLNRVSVPQGALLAGIVQSPTIYDPEVHPKIATQRRNAVLHAMVRNHKLSRKQCQQFAKQPVSSDLEPSKVRTKRSQQFAKNQLDADDYTQSVLMQLKRQHVNLQQHSYQIKVPLLMRVQNKVMSIIQHAHNVHWPSKHVNTAVEVVNNKTGEPVAQVGERNKRQLGSFNQAIEANRSTGSIIKPILDYAPAMDDLGWGTGHIIDDSHYTYPHSNSRVYDWDDQYQGPLTLTKALDSSRNIPAVKTLASVGLNRANKLANLAGLRSQKYYPSAIGADASPAGMASAYSALANNGIRVPLSYVSNINQKRVRNRPLKVMSPQTAFMLTKVLEQVPKAGQLGSKAEIHGLNQAGKTGSVGYQNGNAGRDKNDVSDIWYAGYTKQYTVIVWTGYDNPKRALKQNDSDISETIYKDVMSYLMRGKHVDKSEWKAPSNIESYHKGGSKQYGPEDADQIVAPSLDSKINRPLVKRKKKAPMAKKHKKFIF